ncbi:LamB/YcsF family protein [Cohnella sp. 56]|uniref:LamB/YcsF family protein n=1 Tax=Cohnella sp. 56 TaxID=3113722 RepID=UPI0030E94CF7
MHNRTVDLNVDVGEGFGAYRAGCDEELLELASSANVACGFHAGDPRTMRRTVELCLSRGAAIGAHPGLPDLLGFGRRTMEIAPDEVHDLVLYQIGALQAFAAAGGARVEHVKPHGALYHMAAASDELAAAVVRAVRSADDRMAVYGPPDSCLLRAAEAAGLRSVAEGFADRAYMSGGGLAPRSMPGSVLDDPGRALRQTLALLGEGRVDTVDGQPIALSVQTICLHSDTPGAVAFASTLRRGLEAAGFKIGRPSP